MAHLIKLGAILWACVVCSAKPVTDDVKDFELKMPNVHPQVDDTYMCIPVKMGDDPTYITGFTPHSNMEIAHHMLLFGCEEPGNTDKPWSCGEMESDSYHQAPVCASSPKIVYAWAMDAPELKLPKGVGFKVGGDTDIKWLVLQVHYKDVSHFLPPENGTDSSGVTLHTTSVPQPKTAGVYLLSTGGEIPPHSTTYMESACSIDEPVTVHPFAFRVHAHVHGEVVSGYRIRDGQWTELGRMSPKEPQMFYNVSTPDVTVQKGDILAARCTMVNNEDRTVTIGQTQQDEMCNFYMMYWAPGDATLTENYCTTAGPPSWYWNKVSTIHLENSPMNASIIPGTSNLLKASHKLMENVDKMMASAHNRINEQLLELLGEFKGEEEEEEEEPQEEDMTQGEHLEQEINELKQLNDKTSINELPYELQNEIGGYDPDDYRSVMFGGYHPEEEQNAPYDWFQKYDHQDDYLPYEDDDRVYYPQY